MKISGPFYFPEEGLGLGVKEPRTDDDTALLDDLIDKNPKNKEEPEEKEEPEDLLAEEETEEEEPEPEPEDDLLTNNNRGLDLTKIKDKYPDFAKTNEFKELRNAYHREGKYTELFPTIEDAQEAAENNETFVKLNDALINKADPLTLLNGIKDVSPDAAKKLVGNFLDAVQKFDANLYVETITPIVKRLARQINAEGKRLMARNSESEDGQALLLTAKNIMQFAFEDPDLADKEDPKPDPKLAEKEKELTDREQKIEAEKFQGAFSTAASAVERHLDKLILAGLDPDGKFNEFTRDTLLEKIKKEVQNQISSDATHCKRMSSLWKRAQQDSYNRDGLSRIVSAYLERAKPIIPTVRNKFRGIALKGKQERNTEYKVINIGKGRTGRVAPKVDTTKVDPKKVDYRQTSDDDIFEGRVKLKG